MPADYSVGDYLVQDAKTFADTYYDWDLGKTRGCVCDPEYGDVDCSKRLCPYGTDVMDIRDDMLITGKHDIHRFILQPYNYESGGNEVTDDDFGSQIAHQTFALSFKTKLNETFTTIPIYVPPMNVAINQKNLHVLVLDIQAALENLPNNVIDKVEVHGGIFRGENIGINVTFVGENVQGPQHPLQVRAYQCADGCTPKISGLDLYLSDSEAFSRPFSFGSNKDDDKDDDTVFSPGSGDKNGNLDFFNDNNIYQYIAEVQQSDYNSFECGRRGKCDYTSGICSCFAGYTGNACNTITALV
jgi:hypothetical protein